MHFLIVYVMGIATGLLICLWKFESMARKEEDEDRIEKLRQSIQDLRTMKNEMHGVTHWAGLRNPYRADKNEP